MRKANLDFPFYVSYQTHGFIGPKCKLSGRTIKIWATQMLEYELPVDSLVI